MKIISVRENPEYRETTIQYISSKWRFTDPRIYENCISYCIQSPSPLPQWYLLEKENKIIGCAGLITNDFISRMDLYPWLCALFIDEKHRGNTYASLLIDKAKEDAIKCGFDNMYLCTDHIGYYEKYGFKYIGEGYHPWEESSRIYAIKLKEDFAIRQETERDYTEIYDLIKAAFETAKVSDGDEQDYTVNLRNSKKYIPDLAIVAEKDKQLVGHIMLTLFEVTKPNGTKFQSLLIAPLSVKLEYRNMGIGAALIKEEFRLAKDKGYTAVFLCGDPAYYERFGFKKSSPFGISNVNDIPEQYSLACELQPDALKDISGTIDFH